MMLAMAITSDIEKALKTKEYSSIEELQKKLPLEIYNIVCEGQALEDMSTGKACATKPETAPFRTVPYVDSPPSYIELVEYHTEPQRMRCSPVTQYLCFVHRKQINYYLIGLVLTIVLISESYQIDPYRLYPKDCYIAY